MRKSRQICRLAMGVSLLWGLSLYGQEPRPANERPRSGGDTEAVPAFAVSGSISQESQAAAPRVLKFSGVLLDASGKPANGEVDVTFALYKQEGDEEPLWTETQHVIADERGGYTALLGTTQASGIPAGVFRSDEARWLGVQVQGQVQQPRTLLVSVPYALKAVEAEKLAGKSVSDFVLSESLGDQVRQVMEGQAIVASQATSTGTPQPGQSKAIGMSAGPTGAAGPMFPPSTFSGTNATQIVRVDQNGSGNGLYAQTASSTGNSGVVGVAISNSTTNNQNGVIGFNAGAGAGVAGIATNPSAGVGVYGQGANFAGILGQTFSPNTNGVAGIAQATTGFSNGMLGLSSSPDGFGVNGTNNATTGFAAGVNGFSASANGAGVFGNAAATSGSGFASGVFGQTNSPGGSGVLGIENASTGFNSGVFGQSASGNGTGVFGSSFQWVGVGGQATAPSGGPAYGVWGDSLSTDGSGVAGFADATSGFTNGVYGQSVSPSGTGVTGANNSNAGNSSNGVLGVNNATTGTAYGVNGATQTTGFGAGVAGQAFATTGNAFGVFGQSNSPNGNAMFGHAVAGSGFPTAVVGFLDGSTGGVAGQFVAHTGAGLILQGLSGPNFNQVFTVDANGNLNISGNLVVSGTKSSTAKLQNGREVALYAVESPENWFEDFGSAELKSGAAWVPLDASFAEATNAAVTYHVFLTANGDSNGLYVARKTATGFEVREHGGGGSNVAFDYRIVVRRRGYEAVRMAEVQHDVKTADASRQHLAEFVSSGVQKKVAAVKALQTVTPAAIRPVPQRPNVPQPPKPVIPQVPRVNVAQPPQAR